MTDRETCKQCGGLLDVECIMVFRQGMPYEVRMEPRPDQHPFCGGHPMMSDTEAWDRLNNEQKDAVARVRTDVADYLTAKTEDLYTLHPELRLSWSFTIDAMLRSETEEPAQ